jgi:hypothetical protein
MPGCRCAGGCVCAFTSENSETVSLTITGTGSAGNPVNFEAEAVLVPDAVAPLAGDNPLKAAANGLWVDGATIVVLLGDGVSPLVFANPLKADGDGALYVDGVNLSSHGGMEVYQDHGDAGASETLDLANGNVHRIVLDQASCAITLAGATAGVSCSMTLIVDQDSAAVPGVLTWVDNVDFNNATPPTLATGNDDRDVLTLLTVDGGARWLCFHCATDMG